MAYTLGFPASVTDLIYSLRDWRFEKVRKANGTPTALAIKVAFKDLLTIEEEEDDERIFLKGLFLANMWWYTDFMEYPQFCKKFQALQQHREDIMRQLYFNAEL